MLTSNHITPKYPNTKPTFQLLLLPHGTGPLKVLFQRYHIRATVEVATPGQLLKLSSLRSLSNGMAQAQARVTLETIFPSSRLFHVLTECMETTVVEVDLKPLLGFTWHLIRLFKINTTPTLMAKLAALAHALLVSTKLIRPRPTLKQYTLMVILK